MLIFTYHITAEKSKQINNNNNNKSKNKLISWHVIPCHSFNRCDVLAKCGNGFSSSNNKSEWLACVCHTLHMHACRCVSVCSYTYKYVFAYALGNTLWYQLAGVTHSHCRRLRHRKKRAPPHADCFRLKHTHTHIHYIYIYIYIVVMHIRVCVSVFVLWRVRKPIKQTHMHPLVWPAPQRLSKA